MKIAGWNIFQVLKEHNRSERHRADQQQGLQQAALRARQDMALMQDWSRQRDALRAQGRHSQAEVLERKIASLSQNYLNQIV
jgi:hypothetical protein